VPRGSRKSADAVLLAALVAGATVEEAARSSGVSEATAYRRLRDRAFRAELDDARARLVDLTRRRVADSAVRAVDVLDGLAASACGESVRLGAARTLLDLSLNRRPAFGDPDTADVVRFVERVYNAALAYLPVEAQPRFASDVQVLLEASLRRGR
jgi:AcrR family transcriptional regulator